MTSTIFGTALPTPAMQALNAVRYIGRVIQETGSKIHHLQPKITAVMGAQSAMLAGDILIELKQRGLVEGREMSHPAFPADLVDANLMLAGWEQFEAEARGKIAGKYGFLALAFGKSDLDPFVSDVLKPGIKKHIGFDVVDMRDVATAGVIDNIMRAKIRDAAFVLVDLTDDNSGAYWEAGYAEGLGKPVIYICEKAKFVAKSTHFDTNHCTTVPWTQENPDHFINELVATLRRTLNLFEG